jgi:hypothetical protein
LQTAWRGWVNRQAVFSRLLTLAAQLLGREIVLEKQASKNQCQRVAPVFGCYEAWFDFAPTEIAFREQLAASLRQQAVLQGPGVPADPPAARASRLSAGNLGLNSTGTLQGFRHFSGKPTIRSNELGSVNEATLSEIYPALPGDALAFANPRGGGTARRGPVPLTGRWNGRIIRTERSA